MKSWTVRCTYPAYYANTVTLEAETLDEALERAIEAANDDPSSTSPDYCGPTFVDAVAEGANADPWNGFASAIPVPERFTEAGPSPLITVIVKGGAVQAVIIENGPACVEVRDYDTDGADPAMLYTDEHGDRYVRAEWRQPLPPTGG